MGLISFRVSSDDVELLQLADVNDDYEIPASVLICSYDDESVGLVWW